MFVMRRVYQLEDLGVEVFFPGRASLYLTFKTTADRESFIKLLMQQPNLQLEHMRRWLVGRGKAQGSRSGSCAAAFQALPAAQQCWAGNAYVAPVDVVVLGLSCIALCN